MLRFTSVAHKRRNCKINSPWGRKALPLSLSERITTSKSQCLMPWKFSNVLFCLTGKSTEQQHHAKHETHIYFGRCQSLSIVSDFFFKEEKIFPEKIQSLKRTTWACMSSLCCIFWNIKRHRHCKKEPVELSVFWLTVWRARSEETSDSLFLPLHVFAKFWIEVTPAEGSELM